MANTKIRQISYDDARGLVIETCYDRDIVANIRELPRRKWDGVDKVWTAPAEAVNAQPIRDLANRHGFTITDDAETELVKMAQKPLPRPQVVLAQGDFRISFDKSIPDFADMLDAVKMIQGRKFDDSDKSWLVPGLHTSADAVSAFVAQFNAVVDPSTVKKLERLLHDAKHDEENRDDLATKSTSPSSDFQVADFGVELYPFQKAGVEYALKARRTFIADEQGLGKTFQAIASVHAANAFPVVVVCQGNMKYGWLRSWNQACPNRIVDVLSGKKPSRIPEFCDVVVINYDILDAWKDELVAFGAKSLINDESHNLKSAKAKRTQANLAIAKLIPDDGLVLNLTGTSVLNRPKELAPQLEILGRKEEFGGFKFFTRYCGAYKDRFGWNMNGATNLDELNTKLRETCFVRRLKADVLKDLPAKQRAIIPIEINNMKDYKSAENDVVAYLRKAAEEKAEVEAQEAGLNKEERKEMRRLRSKTAESKAAQAETLVQIQILKQIAAKGKTDAAIEWVEDFINSEKLVFFVHHRAVADEIIADKRLSGSNMAIIRGGMTAEEKQAEVDKFQNDETCRLILCSLKAANTGITLTAASNVAFLELGWTPAEHDQAEDRCHRIGQKGSVTAWYLIAQDTIDENIVNLIESKRKVTTAIMDGIEPSAQPSILRDLMRSILAKKN